MPKSLNVDAVVECVKTVVNSIRCLFCDKINEPVVRYECGHSSCQDCVDDKVGCLLCSPVRQLPVRTITDNPLNNRVKNGIELLNACQDLLNIDVYKRQRLSDQLKIERDLFPECIQAPVKYMNKRKSSGISVDHKDFSQLSQLPGEEISINTSKVNMEKSHYIQQWLANNEKGKTKSRQPFSDITVNKHHIRNRQTTITKSYRRKQTSKDIENQLKITNFDKTLKSSANRSKDESGIVMDDEPIVIDDSQCIDKDKLACEAVLNYEHEDIDVIKEYVKPDNEEHILNVPKQNKNNVPFFKKSYLSDFSNCNDNNVETFKIITDSLSVIIKCDTNTNTTVKICNANDRGVINQSVMVQTDIQGISSEPVEPSPVINIPVEIEQQQQVDSEHMFTDDMKCVINDDLNKEKITNIETTIRSNIIIDETDSENDINFSNEKLLVNAEVHQSRDDIGILREVTGSKAGSRKRRVRAITPASSDSSNKENFDPNKSKKPKYTKKLKQKRKFH